MTAATCWAAVALCAVATFAARGIGPAAAGGRALGPRAARVFALLGPALLAALVVTNALADGTEVGVGADTAGVVVAALFLALRAPLLVVVFAAAATAALLRLGNVV